MRKNIFLVAALFAVMCIDVRADISPAERIDTEYLINNGYSEAMAEHVLMMVNRIQGNPAEPLYEKRRNGFMKFLHNWYVYLDPTIDNLERYHHDIQMAPSKTDF